MGKIVVAASGYFDPLHVGHVEYLEKAKKLGDMLVVIVNNDKQAVLKKGKAFMSCKERIQILRSLACVDFVVESMDQDSTVCKTLAALHPDIFAKGGDRFVTNIPEAILCCENNIKLVDSLGDKIQSSSSLIKAAAETRNDVE